MCLIATTEAQSYFTKIPTAWRSSRCGRQPNPSFQSTSWASIVCRDQISASTRLIFVHAHATLSCMNGEQRISIDPGKRGGKPCIRGLRITVYDVLEYLASGMSEEDILKDFPDLTREDIRACLTFAADRERKLVSLPPS